MNLTKFPLNYWQRGWQLLQTKGLRKVFSTVWSYVWLRLAGLGYGSRVATWIATWLAPPYKMRRPWARYTIAGYIAPSAQLAHRRLQLGANIFLSDRVRILETEVGGAVELGDRVYLHNDVSIQTGNRGEVKIGADTHIQPRCQFQTNRWSIQIGRGVQIAPNCAFYLSDSPLTPDEPSGIVVEDDVWLGHGAVISTGVRIGKGAVIGSGAVVDRDIGSGAIAVGVPARVIGTRGNLA
jgi:acetyltransferase-like isoleucine patch superfamily enzyme